MTDRRTIEEEQLKQAHEAAAKGDAQTMQKIFEKQGVEYTPGEDLKAAALRLENQIRLRQGKPARQA